MVMRIDWNLPEIRDGFSGRLDRFIGPGATRAELNFQQYVPFVFMAGFVGYALYAAFDWTVWQYMVAAILMGDMVGGIITNATSTAKRWYHREGQGFIAHMKFVATHLIQLAIFSWLFMGLDLLWLGIAYGYLIVSAVLVLRTPLYMQRPVALALYCGSLLLSIYVLQTPVGLEWFLPFFYLKLLICHILREEPYRPATEG